jgi:hypothetical protein
MDKGLELKRRILRRKKRRFKGVLMELAKETATLYLCNVVQLAPPGKALEALAIAAKGIASGGPTPGFLEFLKETPVIINVSWCV